MVRSAVLVLVLIFSLIVPEPVWAQNGSSGKEFIMSCTYGVLAGTLVGFASLAFTDQPGENLNKVARGASLGLYLGIALGAYVIYVVPGQYDEEEQILQQPGYPEQEMGEGYDDGAFQFRVFPIISEKGIEGVAGQLQLASF